MKENGKAAYLDTGTWAVNHKRSKYLEKRCCGFFKEEYNHIPKGYTVTCRCGLFPLHE
jgi:phosphoserine aminotransferase